MSPRRLLILRVACVFTLIALGFMAFGILHPRPLAVIAAMSIGQGVGTLGMLMFFAVVAPDIRAALRRKEPPPPPAAAKAKGKDEDEDEAEPA